MTLPAVNKVYMSEIEEVLEAAIYQEIASQAYYEAEQYRSQDTTVTALLKELADEEAKHLKWLKTIQNRGIKKHGHYPERVPDLKLSAYLTGGDKLEGAGLQETFIFAIKSEQQAMEFYANMMGVIRDSSARNLCRRLARAELSHKYKLEAIYDDLFYKEN